MQVVFKVQTWRIHHGEFKNSDFADVRQPPNRK